MRLADLIIEAAQDRDEDGIQVGALSSMARSLADAQRFEQHTGRLPARYEVRRESARVNPGPGGKAGLQFGIDAIDQDAKPLRRRLAGCRAAIAHYAGAEPFKPATPVGEAHHRQRRFHRRGARLAHPVGGFEHRRSDLRSSAAASR
jgi:hypothetical protein